MEQYSTNSAVTIPMRDGTILSGRHWAPASISSRPLLLCRTADDLDELSALSRHCAGLGYRVLLQSVRGRGESGGQLRPFAQESSDGEDTLHFLLSQTTWCKSGVIPFGFGYAGQAALALAMRTPPGCLSGLALSGVTASHFHSGLCTNGLLHGEALYSLTRWLPPAHRPTRAVFAKWLGHLRWQPGLSPFSAFPPLEEWVLSARASPVLDTFWKNPALCPQAFIRHLPDAPVFLCGGTTALTGGGTLELAKAISAHNTASLEFWMGGWDDDALTDYGIHSPVCRRMLDWLAQIAAKTTPPASGLRNIHYLIQDSDGRNDWLHWSNWPSLFLENQDFYLQPGELTTGMPKGISNCDFLDTPLSPSATPQARTWGFTHGEPVFGPQRLPLAIRSDTLAFISEPLTDAIQLLGQPRLRLRVSSSRPDTQFLARLVAMPPSPAPPNRSRIISYGALRLSLRYGFENPVAFSPGTDSSTTLDFPLSPTSYRLSQGCRLRLEISSNDFPRFPIGINSLPSSGPGPTPAPRTARNTIEFDARGTSRITLGSLNKAPP
ncbi:MAG: CocE/NonD family hydrolase [Victivallales bacterium]|nr:CocE/NonD family hydrolase [Victivallales bacterium]